MDVGSRIRYLRKQRDLELQELARRAAVSRPFLSQIELGTANASVKTLQRIADALEVPVVELFAEATRAPTAAETSVEAQARSAAGHDHAHATARPATDGRSLDGSSHRSASGAQRAILVKRHQRKMFLWPEVEDQNFMLTPDLQRQLQVTVIEAKPNATVPGPHAHDGETLLYALEGCFEAWVDGEKYIVEPGYALSFPSWLPHAYRLIGDKPGRAIWVNTPPHF